MSNKEMAVTAAVQRLWDIATSRRIAGETPQCKRQVDAGELPSQILGGGFDLRWERGWAVDAKLSVVAVVDGGRVAGGPVTLHVRIGWSSSELSPVAAMAAASLHQEVAALACWMQTVIDSLPPLKP